MIDTQLRQKYLESQRHKQLMDLINRPVEKTDLTDLKNPLTHVASKSTSALSIAILTLSVLKSIAKYLPKMLFYLPSKDDLDEIKTLIKKIPRTEIPEETTINPQQIKALIESQNELVKELRALKALELVKLSRLSKK